MVRGKRSSDAAAGKVVFVDESAGAFSSALADGRGTHERNALRVFGDLVTAAPPFDPLGRRLSPASVPGYLRGRPSRRKGRRYPPDPPRTEEIIAVMRCCGNGLHGDRARGLIAVLWRAGLRIQEALDLNELDLDRRRGSVLVRRGKGGRRREVGMDDWGFEQLEPWLRAREQMPVGPLFCVIDGRTSGRAWHPSAARDVLRRRAAQAGVRRRFAPHQLRHAHAIELAREGVPLNVIQRQLGHRNLGVTSIYLQGIDPDEIIQTVHSRRPPMIPASVGLLLPAHRP